MESYKIILIGDMSVGKTSIIKRLSNNEFSEVTMHTVGVDFRSKDIDVDGKIVHLQVWDTAGQERFQSISKNFYRGAHGIILVYAIDNFTSFQNVRTWLTVIDTHTDNDPSCPVIKYLVGNKADLADGRYIDEERGRNEAEVYGVKFMETSAKSSQNIEELFVNITRDIRRNKSRPIKKPSGPSLDDHQPNEEPKSSGCC